MDIIIASSRGRNLREKLAKAHPNPRKLRVYVKPGLRLSSLVGKMNKYLAGIKPEHMARCHVYLVAGICDITYRDYEEHYKGNMPYDEVLFNENPNDTFTRVSLTITQLFEEIMDIGATPCMATIVPCSLDTWNTYRLQQLKTGFLLHHRQYQDMQALMVRAIHHLNGFILGINNAHFMFSPLLASTVMTNLGGNRPPRIHYSRLADGVHPTEKLKAKWANYILRAIRNNRDRPNHQHLDTSDEEMAANVNAALDRSIENIFV